MRYKFLLILLCVVTSINISTAQDNKELRRKAFIKNFLNDYKAAYQNEEIDFIRKFFGSDALIITETGNFIPVGQEIAPRSTKSRPYKLLVDNRKSYLDKLDKVFKQNRGINIGISDVLIRKHPKYPDIYGVNFFQIWDDVGDADNIENRMPGYIFLMLDFRNGEMTPIIHVRTWQPQSNIKKLSDKYSLEDFRIITYK